MIMLLPLALIFLLSSSCSSNKVTQTRDLEDMSSYYLNRPGPK